VLGRILGVKYIIAVLHRGLALQRMPTCDVPGTHGTYRSDRRASPSMLDVAMINLVTNLCYYRNDDVATI
jgi:hypothetical protein